MQASHEFGPLLTSNIHTMKKFFLFLLIFVFIVIGGGFTLKYTSKQTYEKDNQYIASLLDNSLKNGMSYDDVKTFFEQYHRELKPWRECEENDKGIQECEDFERIITGLPLPSNNILLGKGDAQIYMIIDKDKRLESFFYEIYFPRNH